MCPGSGAPQHCETGVTPEISNAAQARLSSFEQISDEALDKITRVLKDDRDKNFIAKNAAGVTVNRWITTGMLAASAATNEVAYATYKVTRSAGMLVFDNQARV